jgi:hypothetical protein
MLFFDGSVRFLTTGDSNVSFRPNQPQNERLTTTFDYRPNELFEPPARGGTFDPALETYFRWTREGLHGVDYGGTATNYSN